MWKKYIDEVGDNRYKVRFAKRQKAGNMVIDIE